MKMLWLLVSILVLHQAVAMERIKEPVKTMSELIRPVFGDKVSQLDKIGITDKFEYLLSLEVMFYTQLYNICTGYNFKGGNKLLMPWIFIRHWIPKRQRIRQPY
jgi:hypothetical protein